MRTQPKVAIVMAVCNPNPDFFKKQILSIALQDYKSWTLILRDDASMEISQLDRCLRSMLSDSSFRIYQSEFRVGAAANFSAALGHVPEDCSLIAFADQDDEWKPNKLSVLVSEFENPSVMAAHSDMEVIDSRGKLIASSLWNLEQRDRAALTIEKVILRNPVRGCAMMFRRTLLDQALPIPCQDIEMGHDLWLALAALANGKVMSIKEPLVQYREHEHNVCGVERPRRHLFGPNVRSKSLKDFKLQFKIEEMARLKLTPRLKRSSLYKEFNLGIPLFVRTLFWSVTASRGYFRIGIKIAFGKLLWDVAGD